MDWMEMLKQIFQVCIIPLLGILTVYIVKFINAKSEELKATANNELYQKYITLLTDTITSCVIATNQTYVDALKDKNAFDKEAQKEAFNYGYPAFSEEMQQKLDSGKWALGGCCISRMSTPCTQGNAMTARRTLPQHQSLCHREKIRKRTTVISSHASSSLSEDSLTVIRTSRLRKMTRCAGKCSENAGAGRSSR